jgi:hypothetical protein
MTMPEHLFISSCDGALHDTRAPNWSATPLRPNYSRHHNAIASAADFKACLRAGQYAWPGGYQLYFITDDGATLSFESARENARQIIAALNAGDKRGGWHVAACDINYEDSDLVCDHSGRPIPSAYGDDEMEAGQ